MKTWVPVLVLVAGIITPSDPVQADLIFDSDVTPQVYLGATSVNGNWTIDRANGIELGLRARVRYPVSMNVFNSNGAGTYTHLTGVFTDRALWNLELAANANYDGTSGRTLNDLRVILSIDKNQGDGADFETLNVTDWYFDNQPPGHETIAQNRDNLGLLPKPPFSYDLTQEGVYDFQLTAYPPFPEPLIPLAQTSMRVVTMHEPMTLLGDYNEDGTVDAADYVRWRKEDINGQQGYLDWRSNFGLTTAAAAAAASPEPRSIVLLIFALVVAAMLRRRPQVT